MTGAPVLETRLSGLEMLCRRENESSGLVASVFYFLGWSCVPFSLVLISLSVFFRMFALVLGVVTILLSILAMVTFDSRTLCVYFCGCSAQRKGLALSPAFVDPSLSLNCTTWTFVSLNGGNCSLTNWTWLLWLLFLIRDPLLVLFSCRRVWRPCAVFSF